MFVRIATWRAVTGTAILATLAAIIISLVVVYHSFDWQDRQAALNLAPINSSAIAMPFSSFVWAQVRRNLLLNDELQRLVDRDRLTGVGTRGSFPHRRRVAKIDSFASCALLDTSGARAKGESNG